MPKRTNAKLTAEKSIRIAASVKRVWRALVTPKVIHAYMLGTHVTADWREGGSIIFKGTWGGHSYTDSGEIVEIQPEKKLRYIHRRDDSPFADKNKNYHDVTFSLHSTEGATVVLVSQSNISDKKSRAEALKNWDLALHLLKEAIEPRIRKRRYPVAEHE